jgi:hypothetical protein
MAAVTMLWNTIQHSNDKISLSELTLANVEALASNVEIEFAFCALVSEDLCVVFSDGYYLIGTRQY